MKFNYYTYVCRGNAQDESVLFNVLTGAVVTLSTTTLATIKSDYSSLDPKVVQPLVDLEFLLPDDVDSFSLLTQYREKAKKTVRRHLEIIIETGLDCNLNCSYCYENDFRTKRGGIANPAHLIARLGSIIDSNLDELESLNLSFIGGEPFLHLQSIRAIIYWAKDFCSTHNLKLCVSVDTNGTLLKQSAVGLFDRIFIAISHISDHDVMRSYKSGRGSISKIRNNIRNCAELINSTGTRVSFRYNMHAANVSQFRQWLEDLPELGLDRYAIEVARLVNWEGNTHFKPASSKEIKSAQLEAYRHCISHGIPVAAYPRPTNLSCPAYEGRRLKILTNGYLVACDSDMQFFCQTPEVTVAPRYVVEFSKFDPMSDSECSKCIFLPVCGGKLFCKSGDSDGLLKQCDFLSFDLDDFLRWFVVQYKLTPNLFSLSGA